MRKSKILFICDTVFWYIIYFLPVIMYGIYLIHASESDSIIDLLTFMNNYFGISIISENIILQVFSRLFGQFGVFPIFTPVNATYPILRFLSYFASMVIIHLCVDFLLFIPRLCHKWLDMYTKGVEK